MSSGEFAHDAEEFFLLVQETLVVGDGLGGELGLLVREVSNHALVSGDEGLVLGEETLGVFKDEGGLGGGAVHSVGGVERTVAVAFRMSSDNFVGNLCHIIGGHFFHREEEVGDLLDFDQDFEAGLLGAVRVEVVVAPLLVESVRTLGDAGEGLFLDFGVGHSRG